MKIIYVLPRFPTASETFVAEELIGIRELGNEVTAIALARPSRDQLRMLGKRMSALSEDTIYLPRIPIDGLRSVFFLDRDILKLGRRICDGRKLHERVFTLLRAAKVAKLARDAQADLIFAHWPRPCEVGLLAGKMAGIPVGFSVHAHEVVHDNAHFDVAFEEIRFASFCNEAAMRKLLEQLPEGSEQKACLIYHGVDLSHFSKSAMPPLEGSLKIVSAGRLTRTKGFDRLIQGVAKAAKKGLDLELKIIGDGGERKKLEALSVDLGVDDRVQFAGWVPHEEMKSELEEGHVFALMASDQFHDGLPNVVIESMGLGRSVLISPLPAAGEAIEHQRNGYIFSNVDSGDEFVECCARLIAEPKLLEDWGDEASRTVHRNFDRSRLLEQLNGLFKQVSKENLL